MAATLRPHPLPGGPTAAQQLDSQQDRDLSTQVWAQVGWGLCAALMYEKWFYRVLVLLFVWKSG